MPSEAVDYAVRPANYTSPHHTPQLDTPLILSILKGGDSYGYAIIKEVKRLSANQINWTEGMLYPVLHRLENQNMISSFWMEAENGRKRKYYRIQEEGIKELARLKAQWDLVNRTLYKSWLNEEEKDV